MPAFVVDDEFEIGPIPAPAFVAFATTLPNILFPEAAAAAAIYTN